MDKLAENIKILREKKGLSQYQLANELFITRQAVARWENGVTRPDIETIGKLADIFGVSVEYLITGKEIVKEVIVEKVVEKEVIKEVPVEKVIEKEVVKTVPVETKYWKERMDRWGLALLGYCPMAVLLAIIVIAFAVIGKTLVASGLSCFIVFLLVLILIASYYYKISKDKYKECLRKENELEKGDVNDEQK